MKKTKERIIYDNYDLFNEANIEAAKEFILENEEYETAGDIPENRIYDEIYLMDEIDWDNERLQLIDFFNDWEGKWILVGSVGRWDGLYKGGFLFDTFEEMWYKATEDCVYFKIYDENGHLYIHCSHHDGDCSFEIKKVTEKGYEYFERWEDSWSDKRTEEYIHTQIMNRYSVLPRYAEKVFGLPKVEYEL